MLRPLKIADNPNLNDQPMIKIRQDHEQPESIEKWGWKYHHLGIPTDKIMPNEVCIPQFKLYVAGFSESPFGIEWMRFEKDSPIDKLIQTVPHIAFEVEDVNYHVDIPLILRSGAYPPGHSKG